MNVIKLLPIALVLLSLKAFSQFTLVTNGIDNRNYFYVRCLVTDGTYIYSGLYGNPNGVFYSSNNGDSWTTSAVDGNPIGIDIISMMTKGSAVYATSSGYVWKSTDNTRTWKVSYTFGIGGRGLCSFGGSIFLTDIYRVYSSANNGTDWQAVYENVDYYFQDMVAADNCLLACRNSKDYTSGSVLTSYDHGVTWNTLYSIANNSFKNIYVSGNHIVAVAEIGLYISHDFGSTWQYIQHINDKPGNVTNAAMSKNIIFANAFNTLCYSIDYGLNWIAMKEGTPFVEALLITDKYVFIGSPFNEIWRMPLSDLYNPSSINEVGNNTRISIYPNPGKGVFKISPGSNWQPGCKLEIYNSYGLKVLNQQAPALNSDGTLDLQLKGMPDGIYSVVLHGRHGKMMGKVMLVK